MRVSHGKVVYGMATSVSKKIKKIGYQHALFLKINTLYQEN